MALVPAVFSSSATMADLSAGVRVGAWRMVFSFASWETRPPSLFRAVAVGSSEEDLTAAVYCLFGQNDALASSCSLPGWPVARAHQLRLVPSPVSQLMFRLIPVGSTRRGDVPRQWHRCHRRRTGRREA